MSAVRLILGFMLLCGFLVCGCTGEHVDGFSFDRLFNDVHASPVRIENRTNPPTEIMLFKNEVSSAANALGGVKPGETWGIKKVVGYYLIKVVTKDDFLQNQRNPSQCKIIDTFFIAVDDTWTTNVVTTPDPGPGVVRLVNNSARYVEVRDGSFYGSPLTYLTPNEDRIQYLPYGDYDIFPCYLYVQQSGTNFIGLTRKFVNASVGSVGLYSGSSMSTITIGPDTAAQSREIIIYVKNMTTKGGRLAIQNTLYKSTLDREVINPGGGVQIYSFGVVARTIGAGTLHMKDTMGSESTRYPQDIVLNPGNTVYLIYSGSFNGGSWTLCDTEAEFNSAQ